MKEMRSDPENLREGPVWLFTGEQVKKGNRGGPVFGDVLTEAPPRLDGLKGVSGNLSLVIILFQNKATHHQTKRYVKIALRPEIGRL